MIRIRASQRPREPREGQKVVKGVELLIHHKPHIFLTRDQQRDLIIRLALDYDPDQPERILSTEILWELAAEQEETERAAAAGEYD